MKIHAVFKNWKIPSNALIIFGLFILHRPTLAAESVLVTPLYPLTGSDWNDYIRNAKPEKQIYEQHDETCNPNDGKNFTCLHGGELKKVEIPGRSSCADLQISDQLDAFQWACVALGDKIQIYSGGLKPMKRLRDLIHATTWKTNAIYIKDAAGELLYHSDPAIWWGNPIISLNSGGNPKVELKGEGGIYTLSKGVKWDSLVFKDDKISLVVLSGGKLDVTNPVYARNLNHLWVESTLAIRLSMEGVRFSFFNFMFGDPKVNYKKDFLSQWLNMSDNIFYFGTGAVAIETDEQRNRFLTIPPF